MQSAAPTLCTAVSTPAISSASLRPLRIVNFRTPVLISEGRSNHASFNGDERKQRHSLSISNRFSLGLRLHQKFISSTTAAASGGGGGGSMAELNDDVRKLLQIFLWIAEAVYIIWLFLLPYAPGDPVWAISSDTISSLIGLSLNFFFILPLMNSVGIHLIEAPVLHPMSEGLFNFVVAWTLMFAPLLYTDKRRDRFKGSIDVLWGFQMFLTNTFLIPYMAIRLNGAEKDYTRRKTSQLGSLMINGASVVGLTGGLVCLLSILWSLYGRGDGNFGDLRERWEFLVSYLGSERLAYAFIWDICLYIVFQPWLIGDNLQNVQEDKIALVSFLRFVPVVGLVAYCLCLDTGNET
ncbi:transmembrane protein [Perilla frutescens var. frutescens]|nr:transmembrane protein [Perilla frutescens var. frutescens]